MTAEQMDPRLAVPPLPPRHVARPRLLTVLDDCAGLPLVLLAAGPGSGKTVLLADWVRRQQVPIAWISLTPSDAAPRRFWSLVRSALGACTELDESVLGGAAKPPVRVVQSLLDSLPGAAMLPVLVIDDAHLLTHPAVLNGLDLMVRSGPRLRLVLGARSDPLLPLHRYRLAGLMCELRAAELAMTRGEVQELLAAHGVTLPPQDLDVLLARTEGWVAGLRLSSMRMEGGEDPARFVSELALDQGSIGEYLIAEVLDRQPEPVRQMLVQTSFLDVVTGPLAEAVTGLPGCADMLTGLAAANSFVVPLDAAQTRFRYHQLFAEILRHDVRRRGRRGHAGLMRRASGYFKRIGDFGNALYWAAEAGDSRHAASLLVHGGLAHAFVHGDDLSALNPGGWQAPSPSESAGTAHVREAVIADAAILTLTADAETAARALRTMDQTVDDRPASPDLHVTASLIRLLLGMKAGDARAVDEAATWLLIQSGNMPGYGVPGLPGAVMLAQASAKFWRGSTEDVGALLQAALNEAERDRLPVLELNVLAMIALVESLLSRPQHAEQAAACAHALLRRHPHLGTPAALELAAASRSLIAADLPGAAQALERALIPGGAGFDAGLPVAHAIGQGTLLLTSGDLPGARAVMNHPSSQTDLPLLRMLRETLLADIETLLGRPSAALELLRGYQDSDLAVLAALPRARAFLALQDWSRARQCVRTVLTSTGVSRYTLLEAMLHDAQIAQLTGDQGRALEMINGAIELAQDDIVLPFFAMRDRFAPLLVRHPAVAAQWPLPVGGIPVDAVAVGGQPSAAELPDPLTEREHSTLRFLATGLSAAEIAGEMCLSVNTVKTHQAAIYRKLAVSRRKEAVRRARELELL
ncbi:MAG TPA: LuxR C-terminal-related transcriptional regulator [Streptosporangiaceae bacterium]